MPYCEICKYQAVDKSMKICPNCGEPYDKKNEPSVEEDDKFTSHIDLGAVEEDLSSDSQDNPTKEDDSIELCDPGDLLITRDKSKPASPKEPEEKPDSGKLSDEEVKNIRSNLFQENDSYVSPTDANSILNGLSNDSKQDTQREIPISDLQRNEPDKKVKKIEKSELIPKPAIRKSSPVRKAAYFHRNFIQLTGNYSPSTGEEMIISDQYYLLKPKKIKSQYAIAIFAAVMVVVLVIIGSQFLSPTTPGSGSIIGVILNNDNQPFIGGTEISIPDNGKKVLSDAQGFFRFDKIPTGVYTIQYQLSDGSIISDEISIAGGDISTLTLGGKEAFSNRTMPQSSNSSKTSQANKSRSNKKQTNSTPSKKTSQAKKTGKKYSALKLRANVENARLKMDGQILGSGNLTYKKLRPGKHKAEVSKSGYKTWKGTVTLKDDKTYVLKANLEKIELTQKETVADPAPQKTANDYYELGNSNLEQGNIQAAINDLSEAINLKPSMADAYKLRGDAYLNNSQSEKAENDYVRAGEIYASQKRESAAVNMFEKTLEINKKSIPAQLNLASHYKNSNNTDKALRLYKQVLRQDKNNFTANLESGKIYFSIGKNRDADKKLRKAKEQSPRSAEVYHYLMLNYFARDDFKKVKQSYADFRDNVSDNEIKSFQNNSQYDAIHRIVGEYERP